MSERRTTTTSDDDRDQRVGRILNAFLDARARGEPVNEAELLAQHPDLADELREHLALLSDLRPAAARIESLITQGILTRSEDARYPATLGPYKITGFVGRGGMGVVLKAYEQSLDRVVALKILRPELTGDAAALTRFAREAKAAAALRHPNIVTIHAVGAERGVHYIAMEHVDGPSLAEVIREPSAFSHQSSAGGLQLPAISHRPLAGVAADVALSRDTGGQAASGTPLSPSAPSEPGAPATVPLAEPRALNPEPSLPTDAIRSIFRQLLSALAAAHDAGLIHRDVKSSNILLDGWPIRAPSVSAGSTKQQAEEPSGSGPRPRAADPSSPGAPSLPGVGDGSTRTARAITPADPRSLFPTVKLADFGLARVLSSQTRMTATDSILGTPEYMSPEQARGDTDIDHGSDLYSAGVVLYEMLTGRTPFKADKPSAVIHQILHVDPPNPRRIKKDADPALASLALRLLAKRPEDRLPSAGEATRALAENSVVSVPRPRRTRRRAWMLCAAIAVLLIGTWVVNRVAQDSRTVAPATQHSAITSARPSPDDARSVLVRRGYGEPWEQLWRFPLEVRGVNAAITVNLDGASDVTVAVGTDQPWAGDCLFLLDSQGKIVRRRSMFCDRHWAESKPPLAFHCKNLAAVDLDNQAGDELVVVAGDFDEYAGRISIVDPRTFEMGATFWNQGKIEHVMVVPEFWGAGRPAIIARGSNNKLDGFYEPLSGDDPPRTNYDVVNAIVVLDPGAMEGLGPPRSNRYPDLTLARPHAYAFVNAPSCGLSQRRSRRARGLTDPELAATLRFGKITYFPEIVAGSNNPRLRITLERSDETTPSTCTFTVDEYLRILDGSKSVSISMDDPCKEEAKWREIWRPIIQNGEYIREEPIPTNTDRP